MKFNDWVDKNMNKDIWFLDKLAFISILTVLGLLCVAIIVVCITQLIK
jgi:hypothetical protein